MNVQDVKSDTLTIYMTDKALEVLTLVTKNVHLIREEVLKGVSDNDIATLLNELTTKNKQDTGVTVTLTRTSLDHLNTIMNGTPTIDDSTPLPNVSDADIDALNLAINDINYALQPEEKILLTERLQGITVTRLPS